MASLLSSTDGVRIPLSFNQDVQILGDWLASLRSELPPRVHPHCAYAWEGTLDVPVLQQALDALIARHEALRTAFPDPSRLPPAAAIELSRRLSAQDLFSSSLFTASVWPTATSPLRIHDELMGCGADDPAFLDALRRAALEPRSFSAPPNVRASLFRRSASSGVLLLGLHPLITDNWSVRLIQRDLGTLYRRVRGDAGATLPALDLQYSDFSAWQRRQILGGQLDGVIAYWVGQWRAFFPDRITLDDLPMLRRHTRSQPHLQLQPEPQPPSSQRLARSPAPTAAAAAAAAIAATAGTESITIGADAYQAIRDFARRAEVTSYTFWLCALSLLFHACSGKRTIAFFGNTAGRTLAQTEHVIGWFANSSLIGLRVAPDATARQVLQEVRAATLDAQQREDLPLGALWGTFLKEGRFEDLARGDWIAMNFGEYRRIRVEHWGVDDLSMQPFDLGISARSGTALNIGIMNRGDRFVVSCVYQADRLTADAARTLLEALRRVSETLAADADRPVAAFAREIDSPARATAEVRTAAGASVRAPI